LFLYKVTDISILLLTQLRIPQLNLQLTAMNSVSFVPVLLLLVVEVKVV